MRQLLGNIEEFISLIQSRPALYNFNLTEFNDKILTKKLWEEIAREFNTNVDYCKSKWGTLRVSFARQMRNEKTNAHRTSETLINDWYLKDNMCFMRNFMRKRKKPKSIENDTEDCNNDSSLSKSNFEIKTESNNLSNSSLDIKSESMFVDENESLASLERCSNDDFLEVNRGLSDVVSIASSSVSNNETQTKIENISQVREPFVTIPGSNIRKKIKASQKEDQPLMFIEKRKSSRIQKLSLKRISNEDEDPLLFTSQRTKKEQADLSQIPLSTSTKLLHEEATMHFFKSILPDFNKLAGRRQRLVKQKIMENLNKLLDDQENE